MDGPRVDERNSYAKIDSSSFRYRNRDAENNLTITSLLQVTLDVERLEQQQRMDPALIPLTLQHAVINEMTGGLFYQDPSQTETIISTIKSALAGKQPSLKIHQSDIDAAIREIEHLEQSRKLTDHDVLDSARISGQTYLDAFAKGFPLKK